jgi:hypothetical protein
MRLLTPHCLQAGRCAQLPGKLRDRAVGSDLRADSGGQCLQQCTDPVHLRNVHCPCQVVPLGAALLLAAAHAGGLFSGALGGRAGRAGLCVGLAAVADAVRHSLPGSPLH